MLNAGSGRSDITPPVGIAHAGWGAATHERAEGIHMPFYATALYVTNGDLELAIVDLDMGILTGPIDAAIREVVVQSTGIPADNLRLTATHTHSGPIGLGSWLEQGRELIAPYQESLPTRVAEAVASAKWSARPARVGVGRGECAINVNRRPALPDGTLFTGRNWEGFVDREVGVIGIDDADGNPIATVVNYACHPTILGPANRLLSPDYPGFTRKVVEQHVPGHCLFLQGAAGNCGPTHGFVGEARVAEWLGTRLGLVAAKVRLEIDPIPRKERLIEVVPSGADLGMYEDEPVGESDDTLRVVNHFVDLPAKDMPSVAEAQATYSALEARVHEARATGDDAAIKEAVKDAKRAGIALSSARIGESGEVRMRIQAMRLGEAALVGTPIEAFAEIGAAVKSRSQATQTLFSGYSNGYQGYMPMAEAYEYGGYEVNTTPYAAGAAEDTIEACVEAVNALWR
jgi:neutral ceramidase